MHFSGLFYNPCILGCNLWPSSQASIPQGRQGKGLPKQCGSGLSEDKNKANSCFSWVCISFITFCSPNLQGAESAAINSNSLSTLRTCGRRLEQQSSGLSQNQILSGQSRMYEWLSASSSQVHIGTAIDKDGHNQLLIPKQPTLESFPYA